VSTTPEALTLSTTATDLQVAAGDVLTAHFTHTGTGLAIPAGVGAGDDEAALMTDQSTPVNITGTTQAISATPCTYRGFSIGSTAGCHGHAVRQRVRGLRHGPGVSSPSPRGWFPDVAIPDGVRCASGIYLSTTARCQGHVRVG
jgi:hypothetical protein